MFLQLAHLLTIFLQRSSEIFGSKMSKGDRVRCLGADADPGLPLLLSLSQFRPARYANSNSSASQFRCSAGGTDGLALRARVPGAVGLNKTWTRGNGVNRRTRCGVRESYLSQVAHRCSSHRQLFAMVCHPKSHSLLCVDATTPLALTTQHG